MIFVWNLLRLFLQVAEEGYNLKNKNVSSFLLQKVIIFNRLLLSLY